MPTTPRGAVYPLGIAPYHLADKLLRCHDPNDVLKALPKHPRE